MQVVVVGAGMSGLMAARACAAAGLGVIVVDKGRGPGGRLATRRIGAATVDHGAQFFTVRSDRFARLVAPWSAVGLVTEWCRGFGEVDGHPRYRVTGGMNTLAKHLAIGLDVRCNSLVFAVRRAESGGWTVDLDDGSALAADAVIITSPLPQSASILVTSEVQIPEPLANCDYERTLSLLAVLDRAPAIPFPGGAQQPDESFTFIADNMVKGISGVPSVTMHASAMTSSALWDADREIAHRRLLEMARPWLGEATVLDSQVKRWRFATPTTLWPEPCWSAQPGDGAMAPLVLAGDAFAGPRVEGAALSGLAAAEAVIRRR